MNYSFDGKFKVEYRDSVTTRAGRFSLDTRDYYEIYAYLYGEGPYFYFINDRMYEIKPGAILFVRPSVLVGSCKKLRVRYKRLVCRIPTDMMAFIASLDPKLSMLIYDSETSVFKPEGERFEKCFSLVRELRELTLGGEGQSAALILSVILRLMLPLSDECSFEYKGEASSELIARVIDTVNRDYASISSVVKLAEKMNYSQNYLSQYFKSKMNMGLHDFIITKKLSVAAAKLRLGLGVTEVAYECGFGSTAYFIRLFKEKYGVTPGKYIGENS